MNTETIKNENTTVFGLDMDTYHRIVRFQNLAASYGCTTIGAEAGYRFSEKYNMPLEEAFEYASQFEESKENIEELIREESAIKDCKKVSADYENYYLNYLLEGMEDELIMQCHFELGLDVGEAWDVKFAMEENGFDYSKLDKPHAFALAYTNGATTAYEAWRLTDFYLNRNGNQEVDYEMFSEFLDEAPDRPEEGWDYTYDMSTIDWSNLDDLMSSSAEEEKEWEMIASLTRDEERRVGWEYFKDTEHYFEDESEEYDDYDEETSERDDDTLIDHYLDAYDGDTYEDEFDADDLTIYEY